MILWLLIVTHALIDFPLQGDFLAKAKNHRNPIMGVPWWPCLLAHVLIAGGAVTWVTGSITLGVLEAMAHFWIDYMKNEGSYGFVADQALHVVCKLAWAYLAPLFVMVGW